MKKLFNCKGIDDLLLSIGFVLIEGSFVFFGENVINLIKLQNPMRNIIQKIEEKDLTDEERKKL